MPLEGLVFSMQLWSSQKVLGELLIKEDVTKVEQNERMRRDQNDEGPVQKAMVNDLFHKT